MNYKNNYQRKQAVWREKWLKKEEKRLKQRDWKRLKKDIANFATTVKDGIQLMCDELTGLWSETVDVVIESYNKKKL